MTEILFVTGTDTGVGKTITSAVLARRAKQDGRLVRYVKPVQTGLEPGQRGSDADFVAAVADIEARELLRFPAPLAPAVAAELAGMQIDFDDLGAQTLRYAQDIELLLVEGAGGLLVPLTEEHTMADLARGLNAELVVVARPGLGTLNHTALTLEAAERRGLSVHSIVVSGLSDRPSVTEQTNLDRLSAFGPTLEIVDFVQDVSVEHERYGALTTDQTGAEEPQHR